MLTQENALELASAFYGIIIGTSLGNYTPKQAAERAEQLMNDSFSDEERKQVAQIAEAVKNSNLLQAFEGILKPK